MTTTPQITLHLAPVNGGPFNCTPARTVELSPESILCNDVHLPCDRPYLRGGMYLWVIGNEYGALGAVWAEHEQDALDILCDEGLSAGLMIEEEDADEETARLGNAGEPHDLAYAWMQKVQFVPERDWALIARFAEARGMCHANLDF